MLHSLPAALFISVTWALIVSNGSLFSAACSHFLTSDTGHFESPNHPGLYSDFMDCSWTITTRENSIISLGFSHFVVERHGTCGFDNLTVYDGINDHGPLLGILCGLEIPEPLISSGNSLYVRFRTDYSVIYTGFRAHYISGLVVTQAQQSGLITSPGYPNGVSLLPGHGNIGWTIKVKDGHVITLRFELQPNGTLVKVFDGPGTSATLLDKIQGTKNQSELAASPLRSTSNEMHILFYPPLWTGTLEEPGFIAEYWSHECPAFKFGLRSCHLDCRCVRQNSISCDSIYGTCICKAGWTADDCSKAECKSGNCRYLCRINAQGQEECYCPPGMRINPQVPGDCVGDEGCRHTELRDYTGYFVSPHHPNNYDNNMHCSWTIIAREGSKITLTFSTFQMSYNQDSLTVYDGPSINSPKLGPYSSMPLPITSSSSSLHIVFNSDSSGVSQGFSAYYSTLGICTDYLFGPGYKFSCRCNREKSFRCDSITGVCLCHQGWGGKDCSTKIEGCDSNSCRQRKLCATHDDACVCSSDPPHTCSLCNSTLTQPFGSVMSPGFPRENREKPYCTYTIIGPESDSIISLRLFHFSTDKEDFLHVYDGNSSSHRMLGRFSYDRVSELLRSTGNSMHLVYTAKNPYGGAGFRGYYQAHSCNDFMFGDTCEHPCTCDRNNTQFCDNTNGLCVCEPGWMGQNCTTDVDECESPHTHNCSGNTVCRNVPGTFRCGCQRGFVRNETTGHCDESSECRYERDCSHFCYRSGKREHCSCPPDLVLDRSKKNCVVPYYPFGLQADDHIMDRNNFQTKLHGNMSVTEPLNFCGGVPFGSQLQDKVYIFYDGVICFDETSLPHTPNLDNAKGSVQNLLAPFWAKVNPSQGHIYYHLYEKCGPAMYGEPPSDNKTMPKRDEIMKRAEQDMKKYHRNVTEFDAYTVLVATWDSVQLLGSTGSNTFQAVYISGYHSSTPIVETSYAIYLYQQGNMAWNPSSSEDGLIDVGYISNGEVVHSTDRPPNLRLDSETWNTDYKGVMTYEVGRLNSPEQRCQKYLCKQSGLMTSERYLIDIEELFKCPCTTERRGRQWQWHRSSSRGDVFCYAISQRGKDWFLPNNPRNKLCCYRGSSYVPQGQKGGHILVSDPWRSNVEVLRNIQAHKDCCKTTGKFCDRFYRVFPDMGCTNMVTFLSGAALGDPHLMTLDRFNYTVNGLGEYVLLDIHEANFTLQARTGIAETQNGTLTRATVFTAFAAQERDIARVQVALETFDKTSMVISLDDENLTEQFYGDEHFTLYNQNIDIMRELNNNKTAIVATFRCGTTVKIHVGIKSLEIELEMDLSLKNKTKGLLGNFNGDPKDEFVLPNGTVLSPNLTEREILEQFVPEYLVTPATSVFKYPDGKTTEDYQHPEFVPLFKDELDPSELSTATAFCGEENVACIFDYFATGDKDFAENTRDISDHIETINIKADNSLPSIDAVIGENLQRDVWMVTVGIPNLLSVTVSDMDGDEVSVELVGNLSGVSIDDNEIITYLPSLHHHTPISIRAKDAKGGHSAYKVIKLKICSACNGHGYCDPTSARSTKHTGADVEILTCNCYPAYTGADCEFELDGCASFPCSEGQNCTDLTAEQQGNNSLGYECGPCPAGFRDIDGRCDHDLNECIVSNPCEQECVNTYGSFFCACHEGFRLSWHDKRTCTDINECEEKVSGCQQECRNTAGSFVCGCTDGYTLSDDEQTCILDSTNAAMCAQCEQICHVDNGKAMCGCFIGYGVDPDDDTKCKDLDECQLGTAPCSQVCTNTEGKFECSCHAGYHLNPDRVSCTACKKPFYGLNCASVCTCHGRGQCNPVSGCVCNKGWTGTNCETDVDECAQPHVCSEGLECENELGSFWCRCPDGYMLEDEVCIDNRKFLDEATLLRLKVCPEGYVKNDQFECEDVDECELDTHGCQHQCENTLGGYKCLCEAGFTISHDRHTCIKPCKCIEDNMEYCNTTTGECVCKPEWTGTDCGDDFDECLSSPCSDYLECKNLEHGKFECLCYNGFPVAEDGSCNVHYAWMHLFKTDCNRIITNNEGKIITPNYPRNYSDDLACTWTITAAIPESTISFKFLNYDVEGCPFDFAKIYDGTSEEAAVLGEYCDRSSATGVITSTGNAMHIVFTSDESVNQRGFVASYSSHVHCKDLNCSHSCNVISTNPWEEECTCPDWLILDKSDSKTCKQMSVCNSIIDKPTGVIVPPNYPQEYTGNTNCHWIIKADENKAIYFNLTDVDTEGTTDCSLDFVEIRDGHDQDAPLIGRFCGVDLPQVLLWSTSNSLFIRFHSDAFIGGRGFKGKYGTYSCNTTFTGAHDIIESPGFPQTYELGNFHCEWVIQVSNTKGVSLEVITLDVEDTEECATNYMAVYDGHDTRSPLLGRFCGQTAPGTLHSTHNSLLLIYHSEASDNGGGMRAEYSTYDHCQELNCSHSCKVRSTTPWKEECLCPEWLTLDPSDSQTCREIIMCNSTLNETSGHVTAPHYPHEYSSNTFCQWRIAPEDDSVAVAFILNDLDIEATEGCLYDFLEVRDGVDMNAPVIGRFCGADVPGVLWSTSNKMLITFQSDASVGGRGFRGAYNTYDCNAILTGSYGLIDSPGYPDSSSLGNIHCEWLIQVEEGNTIILDVTDLDIQDTEGCPTSYMELYDGSDTNAALIGRFCGTTYLRDMFSSSNSMLIVYHLDVSKGGDGFTAEYSSF